MAMNWYAVHTYAGQEDKIQQNIERRVAVRGMQGRIGRVVVPTEEETKLVNGKKRTVKKKIFPGYVLVEMEMDDESWHFITETVGVTGFLGQPPGSSIKPPPLTQAEVAVFVGAAPGEAPIRTPQLFHKGERVTIINGPFASSEGRIEDINTKTQKLTVSIQIFGRETKIDLDYAHVERVT
jgi:transcriptional antiterminator NusG